MQDESMQRVHEFMAGVVGEAQRLGLTTLEEAHELAKRSFRVRLNRDVPPVFENSRPLEKDMEFIARPDSGLTLGQKKGDWTAKLYKDGKFYDLLHKENFDILEEVTA